MIRQKNFYLTDWDEISPKGGVIWLIPMTATAMIILNLIYILLA